MFVSSQGPSPKRWVQSAVLCCDCRLPTPTIQDERAQGEASPKDLGPFQLDRIQLRLPRFSSLLNYNFT